MFGAGDPGVSQADKVPVFLLLPAQEETDKHMLIMKCDKYYEGKRTGCGGEIIKQDLILTDRPAGHLRGTLY